MRLSHRISTAAAVGCIALLAGALLGGTADAKKKKKTKGGNVTASAAAVPVPAGSAAGATLTLVPLTIGNKAKGKVVGASAPILTYSLAGDAGFLGFNSISLRLTAPNGRTTFVTNPANPESAIGPLTLTANSPVMPCPASIGPPPPCDPEATLHSPFAGTMGFETLAEFSGIPAKGTWTMKAVNRSTHAATLGPVSLTVPTKSK
jgi:hypothetical protein